MFKVGFFLSIVIFLSIGWLGFADYTVSIEVQVSTNVDILDCNGKVKSDEKKAGEDKDCESVTVTIYKTENQDLTFPDQTSLEEIQGFINSLNDEHTKVRIVAIERSLSENI
jgi:hypothetical protein